MIRYRNSEYEKDDGKGGAFHVGLLRGEWGRAAEFFGRACAATATCIAARERSRSKTDAPGYSGKRTLTRKNRL